MGFDAQPGAIADFLRDVLDRPELALVSESCTAEILLHKALKAEPLKMPANIAINGIQDPDARENHAFFARLQAATLQAGSLEKHYLELIRNPPITLPPPILDLLTEHIVGGMLAQLDATTVKNIDIQYAAAQWLFTPQAVRQEDGRLVSDTLDLSHEMANQLSHGLVFRMSYAKSGLKALSQVLELWIGHLLGIPVSIRAMSSVDDPTWRWHIGLEATSTAILNDLYLQNDVTPQRLQSLISLFRLDFVNPAHMQTEVAGKPVYLGLAHDANGMVKIKPQNLLLNLPLYPSAMSTLAP